jgi:proteasome lid subunit RPN8/RPN11
LSYVSVWKPVLDRVVKASLDSENEVIGLLLGTLQNDTVIINDSITGEYQANQNRATLPAGTLALIANEILSGRIKGNIIGWYHSHTEAGVTFSEIDIETQKILQQFSSFITAIVIDAKTGEIGCFRVEPGTRTPILIPDANVRVFVEPKEAVGPWTPVESRTAATPAVEIPRDFATRIGSVSTKVIIIYMIAAVAVSLVVLGFILYRGFSLRTWVGIT